MKLICAGGPKDGVSIALSDDACNRCTRKPDGLWFNARDETGRNVQHQYNLQWGAPIQEGQVTFVYLYAGAVEACGDYLPAPEPNTTK